MTVGHKLVKSEPVKTGGRGRGTTKVHRPPCYLGTYLELSKKEMAEGPQGRRKAGNPYIEKRILEAHEAKRILNSPARIKAQRPPPRKRKKQLKKVEIKKSYLVQNDSKERRRRQT